MDRHIVPEITSHDGIPVTSHRRTLLDLAGRRDPRRERALDFALQNELATLGEIWLLYDQEWMRGRRGVAILRDLLADRTPDPPRAGALARKMAALIGSGSVWI